MNRWRGGAYARLALSVGLGVSSVTPAAAAKELAPYRAVLSVSWGPGAGSEAFRDDLSRSLAQGLASSCFAGVAISGGVSVAAGAELVVDVSLSHVVDETLFDDSIAGALQPGQPTQELQRVTHFEVTVDATVAARTTGALVSRKHFVAHVSRRPVYVGEDPQATARAEAIDSIVRDLTRALGCGGAKFARKLRGALGDAGPAAPEPR